MKDLNFFVEEHRPSQIRYRRRNPIVGRREAGNSGKLGVSRGQSRFYTSETSRVRDSSPDATGPRGPAMSLTSFLADQDIAFESIPHAPAYTAQRRAKFLRVSGRFVAKSLLMHGPSDFFLAILPAIHHVDCDRLGTDLGGPVRLASDEEISEIIHGCEWGVVPPFGRLYGLPTVLDDAIPVDAFLAFEGQTHFEAIRLRCVDFERLERPRRLSFAIAERPDSSSAGSQDPRE
jgi:Ala-tRNA(Pro) deacylase